jgi:hypothetical protein
VVRLNEEEHYDAGEFMAEGIAHHHLEYEDCTVPPLPIVSEFFRICEETDGVRLAPCDEPAHASHKYLRGIHVWCIGRSSRSIARRGLGVREH